jgi:hypothetical protein
MRNRSIKVTVAIVLVALMTASCASLPPPGTSLTPEERAKAQKSCIARYTGVGAAGGALTGALVGALVGGRKAQGTLIGAAAGGVAGGALAFALAWGHCMSLYSDLNSYPVAGNQETANRVGYNPSQGFVVKIENFSLNPDGISPGGQVQLNSTYYVMAPAGSKEIKIKETRTVQFFDPSGKEWKELGSVDNELMAALGTRRADGNFDLPPDVPEGQYRMTLRISAEGKQDESTKELLVKKGLVAGPISAPPQPQIQQASYPQSPQTEPPGFKSADGSSKSTTDGKKQFIEVMSRTLNVRKEATPKSPPIAVVKEGEVYESLGDRTFGEEKWLKIRLDDGTEGWIQGKFARSRE